MASGRLKWDHLNRAIESWYFIVLTDSESSQQIASLHIISYQSYHIISYHSISYHIITANYVYIYISIYIIPG